MVRKSDNIIVEQLFFFQLLSRDYIEWLSEHSTVSVRLKILLWALEDHGSPLVLLHGQEGLWGGIRLAEERKGTGELSGVYM